MTIHFSILGIVAMLLGFIISVILYRFYIITMATLLHLADLTERVPERYVDLDIQIIKDTIQEFLDDIESRTIDYELPITTGNNEVFLSRIEELCSENELKFTTSTDFSESLITLRLYKTQYTDSINEVENKDT